MRKMLRHALLLGLTLCLPALSRADLIFTLDTPVQNVSPAGALTYTGMLTNLNGPTLFLNGDTFTLDGPGLLLDDTPFLLSAPVSLNSGDSYTGTFFTVSADPGAPLQQAVGAFSIVGGLTDTDQTLLATKEFGVNVVPEPGSLAFLIGLFGMAAFCKQQRRIRVINYERGSAVQPSPRLEYFAE